MKRVKALRVLLAGLMVSALFAPVARAHGTEVHETTAHPSLKAHMNHIPITPERLLGTAEETDRAFTRLPELQPNTSGSLPLYAITVTRVPATGDAASLGYQYLYNGSYPGPTIRVQSGKPVQVQFTNNLTYSAGDYNLAGSKSTPPTLDLTTHLHGGHQAPENDGHPNDVFEPISATVTAPRVYNYPNDQQAMTLWYHDHTDGATADHVARGLFGFYIVEDDYERSQNLPRGEYEVLAGIQLVGNDTLVNGKENPLLQVEPRRYRMRFLNASASNPLYRMRIVDSTGKPVPNAMVQIGSDGGLLPKAQPKTQFDLWEAERYDMVIDFAQLAKTGSTHFQMKYDTQVDEKSTANKTVDLMEFAISLPLKSPDTTKNPLAVSGKWEDLSKGLPKKADGSPDTTPSWSFKFSFVDNNTLGAVNDQPYDKFQMNAFTFTGQTQVWELWAPAIDGKRTYAHPIHLHDLEWQIIEIDYGDGKGYQKVDPMSFGWKDVFPLYTSKAGEKATDFKIKVVGRFTENTGTYVFHCHNLFHEDAGMMGQWVIFPSSYNRPETTRP